MCEDVTEEDYRLALKREHGFISEEMPKKDFKFFKGETNETDY